MLPEWGIDRKSYHESGSVAEVVALLETLYDASRLGLAQMSDVTIYATDSRPLNAID